MHVCSQQTLLPRGYSVELCMCRMLPNNLGKALANIKAQLRRILV